METSLWVHKNVLSLRRKHGIEFQGLKHYVFKLYMKIGKRRQEHARRFQTA